MAVIATKDTRLVVQGITGREGTFHALRNRDYGTNVVAGVTPGRAGQDVDGIPVFDSVADAVDRAGANTALVIVPPRFAAEAILEAADAGVEQTICITEGIPAHDMLEVYHYLRPRGIRLLGPNCPGALSPGIANIGIIPAEVFKPGPIGLVSRSGTLTYQALYELKQRGIGVSACAGIGGDPVPGTNFIDLPPAIAAARMVSGCGSSSPPQVPAEVTRAGRPAVSRWLCRSRSATGERHTLAVQITRIRHGSRSWMLIGHRRPYRCPDASTARRQWVLH